jgi:GNAT superfamily N-acetyltransferase
MAGSDGIEAVDRPRDEAQVVKRRRRCPWTIGVSSRKAQPFLPSSCSYDWRVQIVALADRPDLLGSDLPFGEGWPEIIFHDPVAKKLMPRVDELFPHLNLVVLDDHERVIAGGWGVPLAWDGSIENLPEGWDAALAQSIDDHEAGRRPDTVCTMAAEVTKGHRGRGLGGLVLSALKDKALEHGLQRMIAPARPTLKARYPLTPIDRYARWRQADGWPFDPWLRTHERVGAKVIDTTTRSMRIEGSVQEWEDWAKMKFPESGD